MEGKEIPYTDYTKQFARIVENDDLDPPPCEFIKLGTQHGEIVALISDDEGKGILTEEGLFKLYENAKAYNEITPDGFKDLSALYMANYQSIRAKVQEAKKRHNQPLKTPPVEDTPPPRSLHDRKPGNDDTYGADIHTLGA